MVGFSVKDYLSLAFLEKVGFLAVVAYCSIKKARTYSIKLDVGGIQTDAKPPVKRLGRYVSTQVIEIPSVNSIFWISFFEIAEFFTGTL